MPKALRRFLKKTSKRIKTIKYSFREFLSSKIWRSYFCKNFYFFYFNRT